MDNWTIKIRAKADRDGGEVNIWIGWDGDEECFILGSGKTLDEAVLDAVKELGAANQTVLHLMPSDLVKE